jgi:hypothetical protein
MNGSRASMRLLDGAEWICLLWSAANERRLALRRRRGLAIRATRRRGAHDGGQAKDALGAGQVADIESPEALLGICHGRSRGTKVAVSLGSARQARVRRGRDCRSWETASGGKETDATRLYCLTEGGEEEMVAADQRSCWLMKEKADGWSDAAKVDKGGPSLFACLCLPEWTALGGAAVKSG